MRLPNSQNSLAAALTTWLSAQERTDDDLVTLIQRIRTLQTNGVQIREAILQTCNTNLPENIRVSTATRHRDNAHTYLAIRYRARLLQYRAEGFGYGKIARMLAQRGAYNRATGQAYSRATIQRALALVVKKAETDGA